MNIAHFEKEEASIVGWFFKTIPSVDGHSELLRRRRYGVIDFEQGALRGIHFRPWPKVSSLFESWWCRTIGRHRGAVGDRCRLFYNEPVSAPGFLALPFIESDCDATLTTVFGAMDLLDEIARIKDCRAIVCEVANPKISDRLMRRRGWERHLTNERRRHFIRRFP